jgi:excisionase family DNA binding protein
MNSQVLTVYEAARVAGCTSQWIRVLLAEQRLEGAYKVDGTWRIPAEAIEPLKQRREVSA